MRATSYCIDGEPTGDETPIDYDDASALRPEHPCRHCGSHTTLSSRVCIECELSGPARPAAPILPLHPARRAA